MKQITFASIAYTHKKVTTKRKAFLNEMERVVPWSRLLKEPLIKFGMSSLW